jgi:Uma2 family endonuclease
MADVLITPPDSEDHLPTLAHGAIIVRLGRFLDEYVAARDAGLVCGPQTTFKMVGTPPTRYPDLAFVRKDRLPANLDTDADFAPDLAVEVVSGSDTFGDVDAKVQQYLASGVRLVWLVDPVLRTVTVHAADRRPQLCTEADDLVGDPVLPDFRIPVGQLFPRSPSRDSGSEADDTEQVSAAER